MVSSNFIEALVDKSLELTGNIDTEPETRASRYYPQGYIKAWDDIAQDYVPIGGVKVRARRWFTTRVGYTDRMDIICVAAMVLNGLLIILFVGKVIIGILEMEALCKHFTMGPNSVDIGI